MSYGIITKWECPSCGNIIEFKQVLITTQKGDKYSFVEPKRCACGRKSQFNLLSFEPASVEIKKIERDSQ